MDISFHYFAVKTVALEAGFDDADAQVIAQYSQYIDDYDPVVQRRYPNIPDWLKNKRGSDIYNPSRLTPKNFRPVTTGFMIPADIMYMLTKDFQRNVISPFHFFPCKMVQNPNDRATYPVKIIDGGDGTSLSNLLQQAKTGFQHAEDPNRRRQALMHIGMLLHTFADTYAHLMFSGYNEVCNNMKVLNVTDNNGNVDITTRANSYVDIILNIYASYKKGFSKKLFEIGHMLVGHIPDWTHVRFELAFLDQHDNMVRTYSRDNTEEFTKVALEILDFLCECSQRDKLKGNARQQMENDLLRAFLTADISRIEDDAAQYMPALNRAWSSVFGNRGYSYDHSTIFNGIVNAAKGDGDMDDRENAEEALSAPMSEDFYWFNSYAEDLLIELYGNNPRK